ncbi:MAG TPA: hydrolase [Lachnoclostridium phytofermentans]|uniref:Hydrolase n=1 Tax=Lachnoclostridium phytofermentans TaxID=66219 RepID=A0A3D2X5X7_9FIRM|nr:NlpC/P60 family protein [Lachnoclostridium sp.]HCL02304.1 hydrolase [Lachnoclostridium phytofermentans]
MKQVVKKVATAMTIAAVLVCSSQAITTKAEEIKEEKSLGGLSKVLDNYNNEGISNKSQSTTLLSTQISIPENIAIAKCNDYVNIREKAGTSYNIIGILTKDSYGIVLEVIDGWARIQSGSVTGYVSTDYLYMGAEGTAKAKELASLLATVTANSVNVRKEPSTLTNDNIIEEVVKGEDLAVLSAEVVTKNDPGAVLWVKVALDDSEGEEVVGYVAKDYVDVGYKWKSASKVDIEVANSSPLRYNLVNESKKYIGLRYVWGGTSLTTGADCSGFVWAIYKKCGLNASSLGLPRTSSEMARGGNKVTSATIKPGDLVFYGDSSGRVNHVAMYIGNNQVIHESGRQTGCKISNMYYRKVVTMRSYLQ